MALTESRRRANDKYLAAHYKQLAIRYPAEFVDALKEAAKSNDQSLSSYVREAIEERMQRDNRPNE